MNSWLYNTIPSGSILIALVVKYEFLVVSTLAENHKAIMIEVKVGTLLSVTELEEGLVGWKLRV